MHRNWLSHIVWLIVSACLGLGAILLYALLGRAAPWPAGGGVAGYILGTTSLALIAVAAAYWIREQHTPAEWKAPREATAERQSAALAQARERLADLQAEKAHLPETSVASLRTAAQRILKAAGLSASYRVTVRRSEEDSLPRIRLEPRVPLSTLYNWLLGHQYLGGLSLLVAGLHCGFKVRSPIGAAAMCLLILVVLSGLVGTIIYALVPEKLTALEGVPRDQGAQQAAQNTPHHARYEGALKVWLYVHVPLTVALLSIVLIHVLAVFYY